MTHHALIVDSLTFSRVPFILIWCVCAVVHEYVGGYCLAVIACVSMVLSAVTDAVDGHLARKWSVVSTLGKMADPLMDKVFYVVTFPTLVWQVVHQGECEGHALVLLGLTVFSLLRDTWVTFLRAVGALYGAEVAAQMIGKVRTALSFPGVVWIYLYFAAHRVVPMSWQRPWLWSCFLVELVLVGLTVVSACAYTARYWPYMKRALDREPKM